ncbi:hypothetical protein JB92DRAFT_463960 [Gautieria morchelliformis]|nr:hypothetical protein JB92DRAFT_463960 [Gautieria morchelliformis]
MENCSPMLDIPKHNSDVTSMGLFSADGSIVMLEVWILSGIWKSNPKTVFWTTKPKSLVAGILWNEVSFTVPLLFRLLSPLRSAKAVVQFVHGWHTWWNNDGNDMVYSPTVTMLRPMNFNQRPTHCNPRDLRELGHRVKQTITCAILFARRKSYVTGITGPRRARPILLWLTWSVCCSAVIGRLFYIWLIMCHRECPRWRQHKRH